jgi:hypothetical protein
MPVKVTPSMNARCAMKNKMMIGNMNKTDAAIWMFQSTLLCIT